MFYSKELLSLRRKGKLARCWLAAIFNEKMFKKTCRSTLIKRIDVVVICEEILSTIEIQGDRRYGRFSLYLSSQLMYGVTKILFYQTKFLQDYLFEINWKLFHTSSSKRDFNQVFDLEIPEVAPVTEVFRNLEESANLHLITDEPYTSAIEHMMQDVMNFGVLPNHEMEKFILPEAEEISLSDIRRFCWDGSIEIPAESIQVPLVDVNKFEIETADRETEIRFAQSRKEREALIVVEEHQIANHSPTNSRKRTLRSSTETIPRKKSKVSCVEESAAPPALEPLQMPVHEPGLIFEPVVAPELAYELQQAVAPALNNIELITKPKSRKKRRLFDKQIKLSDFIMRKYIENVAAHTIESYRYLPTLPLAAEYLQQPSTKILERLWGQTLLKLFNRHLITPFNVQDEFQDMYALEAEDAIVGEIIRADTSTKLPDQTGELSSKIGLAAIETTDTSKTLEKIFPADDYQARASEEQIKQAKESEELLVRLPEITGFGEDIGEGTNILEITLDEKKFKNTPECSSSFSSKARLTKIELLTLMQIRWRAERLIKFCELISPENYSKIDAACAFQYCLEFEAERIVILKQAEPFDTIWIEKYPYYITESSKDNVAI